MKSTVTVLLANVVLLAGLTMASAQSDETATVQNPDTLAAAPGGCVVIFCPSNITTCCSGNITNGTIVNYTVTASNICTETALPVTCVPPSGSAFYPGTRLVQCRAVSGNETNTCSFTVTVVGTCLPTGSPQILFDSLTNIHPAFEYVSSNINLAMSFVVTSPGDFRLSSVTFPMDSFSSPSAPVEVELLDSTGAAGLEPGLPIATATTMVSNVLAFRNFVFSSSPFVRSGKRYWLRLRAPVFVRLYGPGPSTQYRGNGLSFGGDNSSIDGGVTWRGFYGFGWETRIQGWPAMACVRVNCPTNIVAACNGGYAVPVNFAVQATNRCNPTDLTVRFFPESGTSFPPGVWPVLCEASSLCETDRCSFTVTVPDNNCSPPACAEQRLLDNLIFPPDANGDFPIANGQWLGLAFRSTNNTLLRCVTMTLKRDSFTCSESLPAVQLREAVLTVNGYLPGALLRSLPAFSLTTPITLATNCAFHLEPPVPLTAGGVYYLTWETPPSNTCYKVAGRGPAPPPTAYIETGFGAVGAARSFSQGVFWDPFGGSGTVGPGLRFEGQTCLIPQCPSNISVAAQGPGGALVDYGDTVTNACTGQPVPAVYTPPSGSLFPVGTNQVLCTVMSDGLTNQCSFLVIVSPLGCCQNKEWVEAPPGGPKPRSGHILTAAPSPGRVLLFGGNEGSPKGDTWVWNGSSWSSVAVSGPPARELAAAAYDSQRGRVVLFGGRDGGSLLGDTWEWDGAAWSSAQAPGPAARHSHAMAYDPARRRVVLFGGQSQTNVLDDTWEYDGSNWVQVASGDPGPTRGHAMAWDGVQVIAFGGFGGGMLKGETWAWNGSAWALAVSEGPGLRQYHAMAYDESCLRVVLFGGGTTTNHAFADTWEWDQSRWRLRSADGLQARWRQAMAHDPTGNQTLLFGGEAASERLGDTWQRVPDRTPPALLSASAVCGQRQLCVTFSEPLDPFRATNAANYLLLDGSTIDTAQLAGTDPRTVCLVLATPVSVGITHTLLATNVADLCGNAGFSQVDFTCEACDAGSAGSGFWLTFPGNYPPEFINEPQPQIFITGAAGVSGTVTASGLTPPFSTNFTIPPDSPAIILLPREADLSTNNDIVTRQGVRISASAMITAYGYNRVPYSTDAYLGLPTNALGRVHMVMTYGNTVPNVPELAGVQFAIVGTQDATTVTILPSADVGPYRAGRSFTVTLNEGDTYQLRNTNNAPADLTGTVIAADRPIAVFGGHACATVPSGDVFFCNHIVEQIPAAQSWGTEFVTVPLAGRATGDTFRVLALAEGTSVWTNGVLAASGLAAGHYHQMILTNTAHIVADKPVLTAQFAHSSRFDRVRDADPLMVLIPPTRLFANHYQIATPAADFPTNFVNLVVPADAVGQVRWDGLPIPASSFSPVAASGYYASQLLIPPSSATSHRLDSANGHAFGLIAYGWSTYDAYGYPGGVCIPTAAPAPQFTCPPEQILAYADSNCLARVPDLRAQAGPVEAAVLVTQEPPPGTSVEFGAHEVVTTVYGPSGENRRCVTVYTVSESGVLQCPSNIVAACTVPEGAFVPYPVPRFCDSNRVAECVPPPGSLFPLGTNYVTCTLREGGAIVNQCSFTVTVRLGPACQLITLQRSGNDYLLAFPPGAVLLVATNLDGPFLPVAGAVSPYRLPVTSRTQSFYTWSLPDPP